MTDGITNKSSPKIRLKLHPHYYYIPPIFNISVAILS